MTEKGATVMAVVVIMLLARPTRLTDTGTERIGVKEDFAIVWSVEVEVEEETEEETVKITEDKENVEVTEEMEAATGMESSETELQI